MGDRGQGRKPTPTALRVLKGNPSGKPLNKREPKLAKNLTPTPPASLTDRQKDIWREFVGEIPAGLLKSVDRSVFQSWVIAFATHQEASEQMQNEPLVVTTGRNGSLIPNPLLRIIAVQATIILRTSVEMGFTPSARSRIVMDEESDAANPFMEIANSA